MMMVFLIPIAAIVAGALIVKWSLDYSRWKKQYDRGDAPGNSLGTSELKALIREAVEEANEPLLDRFETLEARLDTVVEPRLTAARQAPLLDEPLDVYEAEAMPAARPQRVS